MRRSRRGWRSRRLGAGRRRWRQHLNARLPSHGLRAVRRALLDRGRQTRRGQRRAYRSLTMADRSSGTAQSSVSARRCRRMGWERPLRQGRGSRGRRPFRPAERTWRADRPGQGRKRPDRRQQARLARHDSLRLSRSRSGGASGLSPWRGGLRRRGLRRVHHGRVRHVDDRRVCDRDHHRALRGDGRDRREELRRRLRPDRDRDRDRDRQNAGGRRRRRRSGALTIVTTSTGGGGKR